MYTTVISPAELERTLASTVVIDCRFDLIQPEAGRAAYLAAHIPGAIYAHLDNDLSSPKSAATGRHPLPNPDSLAETFARWGIANDTQVIAYDADNGMYAARLWWLLRWLGHRAVAVLNGGFKGWVAEGKPTATTVPSPTKSRFTAHLDPTVVVDAIDVANYVARSDWRLLDARAAERFRGDVEPIDPVAGHIPGARNHPFAMNLGNDGRLLPQDRLRETLVRSLDGVAPGHSIMMCGSGVTACHNLLALEVAGLHGAKLYAGSWSEWIRDPSRPVAKGA